MVKVIALCLLLSGCAALKPQTVYITAPVTPPPVIERPVLEITKLKDGDEPALVVQAHRITIKQLQGYATQLEKLLDAYR